MKYSDPKILSLALSAMVSCIWVLFIALLVWIFGGHLPLYLLAICALLLFIIQFYVIKYFISTFINDRIKLVYKTIHNLKLNKEAKKEVLAASKGDVIAKVEEEVGIWANEQEEEMNRMRNLEEYRRQFLANVSHELKTPLFNIQGFTLSLLNGGLEDPSVNTSYLEKTEKNIDRMITIVEDLEIIARLESGEIHLDFTRFNIALLVREVFDLLEPKSAKRGIHLIMGNEPDHPFIVFADKERIRQVLVNLVDNSIKYGKEGGRTKVSLYDMDENILVEVSDDGIGIKAEHIPRLFERFYRVDKHRSRIAGGSGLGLAIVKHIIEAHEQTVNVRSAPGVGSTFSFTLKKI